MKHLLGLNFDPERRKQIALRKRKAKVLLKIRGNLLWLSEFKHELSLEKSFGSDLYSDPM